MYVMGRNIYVDIDHIFMLSIYSVDHIFQGDLIMILDHIFCDLVMHWTWQAEWRGGGRRPCLQEDPVIQGDLVIQEALVIPVKKGC